MLQFLWIILEAGIKAIIIFNMILISAAFFVYMERKVSAAIQMRIGPNRCGPFGVLIPFADVIKLFMKEDITPSAANHPFHRLAPILSLGVAVSLFAVIPFANYLDLFGKRIYFGIAPDVNIGILYILAMTSVGVYGITLAGWSSNNKYSLLGGLRSSAQMISYELSQGLAVIGVLLIAGTLSMNQIVYNQDFIWHWNIIYQPLGFILFLAAAFAETNRAPFDLPEAEPELVGGFNTEYTGMKFGMFFLAEYANMGLASAIMTVLYLGGWQLPVPPDWLGLTAGSWQLVLIQFATFLLKVIFLGFFFIWVRWSIPRFRYDQLMNLGWKAMLPLAILNVALTALGVLYIK